MDISWHWFTAYILGRRTRPPHEHITLGDDGRPMRMPYNEDGMPPWLLDFLACLGVAGIVALAFVLALGLAPR